MESYRRVTIVTPSNEFVITKFFNRVTIEYVKGEKVIPNTNIYHIPFKGNVTEEEFQNICGNPTEYILKIWHMN